AARAHPAPLDARGRRAPLRRRVAGGGKRHVRRARRPDRGPAGPRAPLHRRRRRARPRRARAAAAAERARAPLDTGGRLPSAHRPLAHRLMYALRVYEYWLVSYRRIWRGTIASSVLNPVLYLTALGVGLGRVVNKGAHPLGIPYLWYVAPGMLAAVAMQVAAIEAAFPVHAAVRWSRQYFAMLATPLRVRDLISGHLLYVATRAAMTGVIYLVVISAFGAVRS